jgi:preprotein translocase subunit Sec61beta
MLIKMAEKKTQMPTSIAGLVRYEEGEESFIKLKPVHVIGIAISLIILETFLFLVAPI